MSILLKYRAHLTFVAAFVAMQALWPSVGATWGDLYRAQATACIGSFGAHGEARFLPVERPQDWQDTEVLVLNHGHLATRERVPAATFRVSSRYTGYLEQSLLLSLLVATPMTLRRRLWVTPLALGLGQLGVVARLWLSVRHEAMQDTALELGRPPAPLDTLLTVASESFVKDNLEAGLILALLVWASIGLPPDAWTRLLSPANARHDAP